jgi:hypothetical protein
MCVYILYHLGFTANTLMLNTAFAISKISSLVNSVLWARADAVRTSSIGYPLASIVSITIIYIKALTRLSLLSGYFTITLFY